MSTSFLERALAGTLPDFQARWQEVRRTYSPDSPPSADDFLGHLTVHVQHALAQGRVAEMTRLFLAVERLLGEADPVLADLLEDRLIAAIARECRDAGVADALVVPHLGPRSRAAWARAVG